MPNPPTPNMNLIPPTVSGDFDEWGQELNEDLSILDSHTHQIGSGVPITPLGLNINTDLSIQGNNINLVRALRMNNQSSSLAGPGDVLEIYPINGDLWYNNAAGVPVRLTNGTSIASNATASTIFPQTSASSSFTILSSATYIQVLCNTTSVACTVNLPSAASVGAGRYFIITDVSNNAATHNITINPNGTDTILQENSAVVFVWNGQSAFFTPDGSNNWNLTGNFKPVIGSAETLTNNGTISNEGTIQNHTTIANGDSSTTSYSGGALVTGQIIQTAETLITGGGSITTSTLLSGDGYIIAGFPESITTTVASGIASGIAGGIALTGGAADWITFGGNPRSHPIWSSIIPVSLNSSTWDMDTGASPEFNPYFGSVVQITTSSSLVPNNPLVFTIPPHNGATLASVTLSFAVANLHSSGVPQNFPNMSVIRTSFPVNNAEPTSVWLNSSLGIPLSTTDSGTVWYNGYELQQFTYTCNQNNIIDTSQYVYNVVLYGEYGTHSATGNVFFGILCDYNNILNMQFT
jgi:hypothetical protein